MDLKKEIFLLSNKKIKKILEENKEIKGFKERNIYKIINQKNNVVIIGLRRIGKTELLNQFIKDNLFIKANSNLNDENIEESFSDKDVVDLKAAKKLISSSKGENEYSGFLYVKLDSTEFMTFPEEERQRIFLMIKKIIEEEKIKFLLLDEIQVIKKWPYFLKDIIDEYGNNIRIIATGSNSQSIISEAEKGTDRFQFEFFGVLSYEESKIVRESDNLPLYIDFLHFPHYDIHRYNEEVKIAVIEQAFNSATSKRETLLKVLIGIIKNVGSETNQSKISNESGVNKTHINKYIQDLIDSQLLFQIKNKAKSNQNIKLYPLIPGLYRMFTGKSFEESSNSTKGHLFEQFVLIQLLSKRTKLNERMGIEFFRYKIDDKIYEIDFIINNNLIEVKYSKEIKDIEKYLKISKKLENKNLYFIYLGDSKEEIVNGIKITFINWKEINKYEF